MRCGLLTRKIKFSCADLRVGDTFLGRMVIAKAADDEKSPEAAPTRVSRQAAKKTARPGKERKF